MQLLFPSYVNFNFIQSTIKETMIIFIRDMNNHRKFNKLDKFLYNILGRDIKSVDILCYAINSAFVGKYKDNYVLDIDSKSFYANTDYTVSSLIKLIEFGNLEVKGTNALARCFNYIRNKLDFLWLFYNK